MQSINVPVFEMGTSASPVDIARAGVAEGKRMKVDAVIVDTAGRLQVCAAKLSATLSNCRVAPSEI